MFSLSPRQRALVHADDAAGDEAGSGDLVVAGGAATEALEPHANRVHGPQRSSSNGAIRACRASVIPWGVHPPMHRVVAGRWRILYEIDDARGSVFILCISRRETAYDDLPSARAGGDS